MVLELIISFPVFVPMIPNSEDRFLKSEYEYNRRRFAKLSKGKARAFGLFCFSAISSILCLILFYKWGIFNRTLVIRLSFWFLLILVFSAFVLLHLYSLQVLITIWKEISDKDEYTPYLTIPSNSHDLSAPSLLSSQLPAYDITSENGDSNRNTESQAEAPFRWKLVLFLLIILSVRSVKNFSKYLVTPMLLKGFKYSDKNNVTTDGECGTFDVRNQVYADDKVIKGLFPTISTKEDGYTGDSLLQTLEYKVSYP